MCKTNKTSAPQLFPRPNTHCLFRPVVGSNSDAARQSHILLLWDGSPPGGGLTKSFTMRPPNEQLRSTSSIQPHPSPRRKEGLTAKKVVLPTTHAARGPWGRSEGTIRRQEHCVCPGSAACSLTPFLFFSFFLPIVVPRMLHWMEGQPVHPLCVALLDWSSPALCASASCSAMRRSASRLCGGKRDEPNTTTPRNVQANDWADCRWTETAKHSKHTQQAHYWSQTGWPAPGVEGGQATAHRARVVLVAVLLPRGADYDDRAR